MNYPPSLGKHKWMESFDFNDKDYNLRNRRAYYYDNDWPLLMHSHKFYELNIVTQGEGRHYIENKSYPARKGDVFAFSPNIHHGYWTDKDDGMVIFHLLIDNVTLSKYSPELDRLAGFRLLFEIEPHIRQQSDGNPVFLHLNERQFENFSKKMDELVEVEKSGCIGEDTIITFKSLCLLCDLSLLMADNARYLTPKPTQEVLFVMQTMQFMNSNFNKKISINELAKIALMSRATFVRAFRKHTGTSPMQYLKQLRIRNAAELLKNSESSITDIALDCGFFDSSYFIRTFKEIMNLTPIEYRCLEKDK